MYNTFSLTLFPVLINRPNLTTLNAITAIPNLRNLTHSTKLIDVNSNLHHENFVILEATSYMEMLSQEQQVLLDSKYKTTINKNNSSKK